MHQELTIGHKMKIFHYLFHQLSIEDLQSKEELKEWMSKDQDAIDRLKPLDRRPRWIVILSKTIVKQARRKAEARRGRSCKYALSCLDM
jgi:hypothetical protein